MELESIGLSEETQAEKDKPHVFSVIYGSWFLIFTHGCLCRSVCVSQTTRKGPIRETLGGGE